MIDSKTTKIIDLKIKKTMLEFEINEINNQLIGAYRICNHCLSSTTEEWKLAMKEINDLEDMYINKHTELDKVERELATYEN